MNFFWSNDSSNIKIFFYGIESTNNNLYIRF